VAFSKSATRRPIMLAKSVKAPRSSLTSIGRVTRIRRAKVCSRTISWLSDMVPAWISPFSSSGSRVGKSPTRRWRCGLKSRKSRRRKICR
jgi:hypothetical protein